MSNDTLKGKYKARAVAWELAVTKTGKEQVAILFRLTDEHVDGREITYYGFFTDATAERTMESLRICGWQTDSLLDLSGLDTNEVELDIAPEEYQGEWTEKVKWINRPGGGLRVTPMDDNAKKAFDARMKGLAVKSRSGAPAPTQKVNTQKEAPPSMDGMPPSGLPF